MKHFAISIWQIWLLMVILSVGGYLFLIVNFLHSGITRVVASTAFLLMVTGWVYVSVRVFRFYVRLRAFFRRLLFNDYSVGIRDIPWIDDEITELTEQTNKTADQLRTYDELRAEKTGLSFRAMDLLFRNSDQGIILADMEKKVFRFNPVIQEMYGVKQETYSYDTIENQSANSRFVRIFLIATLKEMVTKEATAALQLPQRETVREISFRLEPLKDHNEKVRFAFIFITSVKSTSGECRNEKVADFEAAGDI